jgi:hypothetical protein
MSVNWTPSGKTIPVAEYRSMVSWRESKRYREITGFGNETELKKIVKSFNPKPEVAIEEGKAGSNNEKTK